MKKLNESLKSNAKVILRKETFVVRQDEFRHLQPHYGHDGRIDNCFPKIRRTVESSESYINFEDVRIKVENEMREQVERSIKDNKAAYERYLEKYNALESDYQKKRTEIEESCKKKLQEENDKLRDEYKDKFAENEREKHTLILCLNRICSLAEKASTNLENRFFRPTKAIEMINTIFDIATDKKV